MKIVIDAMGGDNAPKAIVDGAVAALKKNKDIEIILTGKSEQIFACLKDKTIERLSVVDAKKVITNNESPTQAFKEKTDSSLVKAYEILKNNEADALISAGSTGAILVGGFTKIGRIKGVSRPALSPLLPTKKGSQVLLLDVGANMDAKAINLLHFAIMGSSYMKACFDIHKPKVALLNVGTEDEKGNELTKEAFALLKEGNKINFVGNIEARDITSGDYDVIVADGFAGNVALKSIEGAVSLAMGEVKRAFKGIKGKLAAAFVFNRLRKSKTKLDYHKYGGSPFLGCKKIIIKSHGSSKAETIKASIHQAYDLYNSNYIEKLETELEA
ncbi:MAG: phosphate acyltransferase PlsX [Christensenellales bacterium]|jgi:glycerol-3-phosphate acyltransferase PlsX